MAEIMNKIKSTIEDLKQQRDELNLQMHLAKAEVKDEWEQVEKKWGDIESKLNSLKSATAESSKNIWAALGLLADEIASGYKRIKKS